MSFLGRFLNKKGQEEPIIPFGRYSDAYKSDAQYLEWDNAVQAFEEENYLQSLEHFLEFLKNEKGNNIRYWIDRGVLNFEIIQGSKKIIGLTDSKQVEIEAKVAQTDGLDIRFMRQLMERNYELKYSRFALDENDDISMRFDTDLIDASPYKLYNALKEVAINADKLDDLLIDEYEVLMPINNQHIESNSEEEAVAKYAFVQQWIQKTLTRSAQLDKKELEAGEAYLLLDLTYKLDYLISPEGFMMETLERTHRQYFSRDGHSVKEKSQIMRNEFQQILNKPKEELQKEFYHTIATFGITSPVNHDRVVSFIDGELPNMDWYLRNNYPDIALAIPGYIAGYCMFEFAVPQPDKELFHFYFEVIEGDYFQSLGFKNDYYNSDNGKFNKSGIRAKIQQIAKSNRKTFPNINPNVNILDFKHLQSFAHSYMMMMRQMDLSIE